MYIALYLKGNACLLNCKTRGCTIINLIMVTLSQNIHKFANISSQIDQRKKSVIKSSSDESFS